MRIVPPGHSIGRDLPAACQNLQGELTGGGRAVLRANILALRTSHQGRGLIPINRVALGLAVGADISVRDGGANRALLTAQQIQAINDADTDWGTLKGMLIDAFAPGAIPQAIIDILRA